MGEVPRGPVRRIVTLMALAAAVAVSQSFGRFTYSLLYTDLRDGFGLSNTAAGALGSLNLVAYVLGSLAVSITVGRTGLGGAARIGLVGAVAGLGLLAWSPSVAVAAAALALTGFAAAGVWIAAPGLAADLLGPERRGAAAGWLTGGVGAGMVAAAAIDAALSDSIAGQSGTSVPLVAVTLDHPRSVYKIELLIGIAVVVTLLVIIRNGGRGRRTAGLAGARAALAKVPKVSSLLATYGMYAFTISTVLTFVVGHLDGYDGTLHSSDAALAFSFIGIGSVAGGPIFGRLADRLGRRRSITVGQLLAIVSIVTMTSPPTLHWGRPPLAFAAAFVFGTAFTGVIAAIAARMSDSLEGDEFGAAYGLATIVFGAGLAAGPQTGGVLADRFDSFGPAFGLAVAACIVGIALTGWGHDPASARATS